MADPISLPRLLLALLPVAVFLTLLWRTGRPVRTSLQGLARMLIQLLLVGYFLVYLFESIQFWVPLLVLTIMLLAASLIAMRTSEEKSARRLRNTVVSIALGGGTTLAVMTQGVLVLDPWYDARVLIPLAGMTFSNCMNAISLAAERFDAARSRDVAVDEAAQEGLTAALIPITNSLFAVGVVSIPGMMTGQVLAGVSPLIAARYQIMIMCMIFASAGLSVSMFLWLDRRTAK